MTLETETMKVLVINASEMKYIRIIAMAVVTMGIIHIAATFTPLINKKSRKMWEKRNEKLEEMKSPEKDIKRNSNSNSNKKKRIGNMAMMQQNAAFNQNHQVPVQNQAVPVNQDKGQNGNK